MPSATLWFSVFALLAAAESEPSAVVSAPARQWQPMTITFQGGPELSETGEPNPFRDYRLDVAFSRGDRTIVVPGYFAADGNAAESGAAVGRAWRVHFLPDQPGAWSYRVRFRSGKDVAMADAPTVGKAAAFDGMVGRFDVETLSVTPPNRPARPAAASVPTRPAGSVPGGDFYRKGLLRHVGRHYLQFAATGEYFLKSGADSPENFLAYADFDGTYRAGDKGKPRAGEAKPEGLHRYEPHLRDWREGDPTWRNGRGKAIIGALNYLASEGVNSVYFLTMNVGGDGKDVWPWVGPDQRDRFDCSKLDQWEIVFSHMDRLGIMLHVVTQETENDQLLDGGDLGPTRRLYYRELVARFAHHPALVWNLGEENTNTRAQRAEFCRFLKAIDPYDHPIAIHTFPGKYDDVYEPLLGNPWFDGPSLQMGDMRRTHAETVKWWRRSAEKGRPWFVSLDEIGPADTGVKPDRDDPNHDDVRRHALWGNLMGGGAGCEWYFGYKYAHNDLNCEDFRSRENLWRQSRAAIDFFHQYLPLAEMRPADELIAAGKAWCLAAPGKVYAVYLHSGGTAELDLAPGEYRVEWYDPRRGGPLQRGSVEALNGPGRKTLGNPPSEASNDWAVLVRRR